jgi:hypothetical protein
MLAQLASDEYRCLTAKAQLWVAEGEPMALPDQEVDQANIAIRQLGMFRIE